MDEEDTEFDKNTIDRAVEKVEREAHKALETIDAAYLEISDALLYSLDKEDKVKSKMVVDASALMKKEEELVKNIVELVKILSKFVKNVYRKAYQLNVIPESFILLGRHWNFLSSVVSQSAAETNRIAALSSYNKSASNPMIRNCCRLVIAACLLERHALTKKKWDKEPDQNKELGSESSNHPDGMIGHVCDVLWAYDSKYPRTEEAKKFRSEYREEADKYLCYANNLEKEANKLMADAESQPSNKCAEDAVKYLKKAFDLMENVLKLVKDASKYIERLPEKPIDSTFEVLEDVIELHIYTGEAFSEAIYTIEILPNIQDPPWEGAEGQALDNWHVEEVDNGVKFYSENNTLFSSQGITFKFKVQAKEISDEIRFRVTDKNYEKKVILIAKKVNTHS